MGGLRKKQASAGGGPATPNQVIGGQTATPGKPVSSGGFADDGARRMPSASDSIAMENLRKLRATLSSRSGRGSTNLSGTRSYVNTFLGGTL